ncbi:MAG: hypothetical protein ACKOPE_01735 [Novosphingobium sp.]
MALKIRNSITLAAAALLGGIGPASAAKVDSWPLLAFDRAADCELKVVGDGKFLEFRAAGLIPGEATHFTLSNGDMKPLDWKVYADGAGRWSQIYIPFRFNRDGGTVVAGLGASRCTLSASVPWSRGVRVID